MTVGDECISARNFDRLRELISREVGISLGTDKKTMLEGRIRRRLRELNLSSYGQYCDYLFTRHGAHEEIVHFIDVVTTNKTDFFREPRHFEFLTTTALPELAACSPRGRPLLVWSAGCSTGEEPYTLAIVLSEFALTHSGLCFGILATDISTRVLKKARMGVYTADLLGPVPAALRNKYFMRSREPDSDRVRVVPELRRVIEFRRLNFMEADYGIDEMVDAVFCRNVIIYFDRPMQERILRKITRYLLPGGYLFVGHAESLHAMDLPLAPVAPSLYRRVHGS
jgi:chemotaxis protein methyltransferase CheR